MRARECRTFKEKAFSCLERDKSTANAGAAPGGGHDLEKGIMILPSKDGSARTAEG